MMQAIYMYIAMLERLKGKQDYNYKHVGGARACFCTILNMFHIRGPFFKIKKYFPII